MNILARSFSLILRDKKPQIAHYARFLCLGLAKNLGARMNIYFLRLPKLAGNSETMKYYFYLVIAHFFNIPFSLLSTLIKENSLNYEQTQLYALPFMYAYRKSERACSICTAGQQGFDEICQKGRKTNTPKS